MKNQMKLLLAVLVLAIASSFIADAAYTIDPKSSSIAVTDVTDISKTFIVYNTWDDAVLDITASVYVRPYNENLTFAHPLPQEFIDSVTIIPNEQQIGPNSSGTFTMHLSLPDKEEVYNNTFEFVIRFNNSDEYSMNKVGGGFIDIPVRIYLPSEKIIKEVFPWWTYPVMGIGVLVFVGIIVYVTRRIRRPVASHDRAQSGSEWAGTDMHVHDGLKRRKKASVTSEWEDIGDTPFHEQEEQETVDESEEEYEQEGEEIPVPVKKSVKKQVSGKLPIEQPKIVKQPIITQQRGLVSSSGIKKRYPIRMGDQR